MRLRFAAGHVGRTGASLVVLVVGVGVALGAGSSSAHPKAHVLLGGSLSESNSHDGQAIFSADGLAPGDSASGTVTIGNTGTVAGALRLAPVDLIDTEGSHAGVLSNVLEMQIEDVTGDSGAPVYDGVLAQMPGIDLSTLVPGDQRTYRFTATVPEGGIPASEETGDNALQGSAVSVGFGWTLTQTTPARCENQMRGTAKGDRLIGSATGDTITGLGGNDTIKGMLGDDCLNGGSGKDIVLGNGGNDTLIGGTGRDRLSGGGGSDVLRSRDRSGDVLDCGGGKDTAKVDRHDRTKHCEQVKRHR
jgi:Ca2+-binding RTX toxin-like protein